MGGRDGELRTKSIRWQDEHHGDLLGLSLPVSKDFFRPPASAPAIMDGYALSPLAHRSPRG